MLPLVCCETVSVCLLHLLALSHISSLEQMHISSLLFVENRKQVNKDFLGVNLRKNN